MNVIVVNHLPCKNNELGLCTGLSHQGVSKFGRTLAHYVRPAELEYGTVSAIFCSTLPRARESAELCFGQFDLPTIESRYLCALDYGDYQDTPMEDIVRIQSAHVTVPFPRGECYEDMACRMRMFLRNNLMKYKGKSVIIIGHYATREVLQHVHEGISLSTLFRRIVPIARKSLDELEVSYAKQEYKRYDFSGIDERHLNARG